MKRLMGTIAMIAFLGGCQEQPVEETTRPATTTADNGQGSGSGTGGAAGGSTTPGSLNFNSALYFEKTISPLFKAQCETCHVGPRVTVPRRGPQTIYSFQTMEAMLKDAKSLEESLLWQKVTNKVAHTAGDMCFGDPTGSPCKEISDWYKGIFGSVGEGSYGEIVSARYDGTVSGWALNPADKTQLIDFEVYVGGAHDAGGKLVTTSKADKNGFDGNNGAKHAFIFDVPDAMITHGKAQPFYVYAIVGGEKKLLSKMPYSATMYVPQAAGRQYFDSTLLGGFACGGCHGPASYDAWYPRLVAPLPSQGGTAATSRLVTIGCQGTNHPGGAACNAANVQTWWEMEFGGL